MSTTLPLLLLSLLLAAPSPAVILISTGDPSFNTTEPSGALQDSGWQFQGQWNGVLGTAIGPQSFVTATHVGGHVGDTFVLRGVAYVTDGVVDDTNSDLAIWHVTTPFPDWAPLYRNGDEVGKDFVVFGRGTDRGDPAILGIPPTQRGWYWGPGNQVQRWGTNTVSEIVQASAQEGNLLAATFDLGVSDTEATISSGDSGGAWFIRDTDGLWKLAGLNYEVDDYALDAIGDIELPCPIACVFGSVAALYDQSQLFFDPPPSYDWVAASGAGRLYATRISSNVAFIDSVVTTPEPRLGEFLAAAALALRWRSRSARAASE
jgi:hypothetical protein